MERRRIEKEVREWRERLFGNEEEEEEKEERREIDLALAESEALLRGSPPKLEVIHAACVCGATNRPSLKVASKHIT